LSGAGDLLAADAGVRGWTGRHIMMISSRTN
jgi:hypothetical protein